MKIIITEAQYDILKGDQLKKFLFNYWDKQKKQGIEPYIEDFIYDVTGIIKHSQDDKNIIRKIWYDYNGGLPNVLQKIKDEILHDEIEIFGEFNLHIFVFISDIVNTYFGVFTGIDIDCNLIGGTIDNYTIDEDDNHVIEKNKDIYDVIAELEYDRGDLYDFIEREIEIFLKNKIGKYRVPFYINFE